MGCYIIWNGFHLWWRSLLGCCNITSRNDFNYQPLQKEKLQRCLRQHLRKLSFNFIILVFADVLSFRCQDHTLYKSDQSSFLLLVLGFGSLIVCLISLLISMSKGFKNSLKYRIPFYIFGVLFIGIYITFLVLSNINLGLSFAPFVGS